MMWKILNLALAARIHTFFFFPPDVTPGSLFISIILLLQECYRNRIIQHVTVRNLPFHYSFFLFILKLILMMSIRNEDIPLGKGLTIVDKDEALWNPYLLRRRTSAHLREVFSQLGKDQGPCLITRNTPIRALTHCVCMCQCTPSHLT